MKGEWLKCTTNRPGEPCLYMRKDGCMVVTGCLKVVEQCEGCRHKRTDGYCEVTPWPISKWDNGMPCNYATHTRKTQAAEPQKKINPLKASKRKAEGGNDEGTV